MTPELLHFADVLSAQLFSKGWVPTADAPEGCIRCLLGPASQIFLVDASTRSSFTLADEPLVRLPLVSQHGSRLVLYLAETDLGGHRKAMASAAKRNFLGTANSLGLIEIASGQVTLSKPPSWMGSFQPKALVAAIKEAFEAGDRPLDFHTLVQAEVAAVGSFSAWAAEIKPFWTPLFLGVCVLLTVISEISGGSTDSYTMYRMGALWRNSVVGLGEWWRLATSMMLHFGWLHLLCNMYSLSAVGTVLERILGGGVYLLVLLLSGLGGALFSLWGHDQTLSAGLSGAIFGLAASTIVLIHSQRIPIPKLAQRGLVGGLAPAVLYNLVVGLSNSGIDNYAHVGGLVTGGLVTWMLYPRRSQELWRRSLAKPLWIIPVFFGASLIMGAVSFFNNRLPMARPYQSYEIGGTRVSFGRQFGLAESQGVVRIYAVPGCVLCFGTNAKSVWPNSDAFVAQVKKELTGMTLTPATLSGHSCLLLRGKQNNLDVISCRVLDVGTDVLEVAVIGQFVDHKRELELIEAILSTLKGGPSKWGN